MRTARQPAKWNSDPTRVGAVIAVAIHIAIIAAIIARPRTANFTAGYDSIEGSPAGTTFGGSQVKPIWNVHTLAIVDGDDAPLDSARVHETLGDSVKVTSRNGEVMFAVRRSAMFLVRITRRGYEPLTTRIPNNATDTGTVVIHLVPSLRH